MTGAIALTRRRGEGWLVLIGGASGHWATTETIDRAAIAAIRREGPIAFLPTADCADPTYGETFLSRYTALGAPAGYTIPICDAASAGDAENARAIKQASLIYIGGGDTRTLLAVLGGSAALEALGRAYEAGAVIVGASAGAIALSAFGVAFDPRVGVLQGWGWLPEVLVSPHATPERDGLLRAALAERPELMGVAIPDDVALALGPDGAQETWGAGAVDFVGGARRVSARRASEAP